MTLRSVIILLTFPLLFATQGVAQTVAANPDNSHFTITVGGGIASGVSPSMRGTNAQFQDDLSKTYNNSTFPFGDPRASGESFNLNIEYRFRPSPISIYVQGHATFFTTSDTSGNQADLNGGTFSIGPEYTYDISSGFDIFGRAGANFSFYGGDLLYIPNSPTRTRITDPNLRFGFELGLGADLNPWSIFVLRPFLDYVNVNLIGKSYTAPDAMPPEFLRNRALNDGANPNDPNDSPRTIDFLEIGIGIGLRF